jgi:hypothetical protein
MFPPLSENARSLAVILRCNGVYFGTRSGFCCPSLAYGQATEKETNGMTGDKPRFVGVLHVVKWCCRGLVAAHAMRFAQYCHTH